MTNDTTNYDALSDEQRRTYRAVYEAGFATGSGRPWDIDPSDTELISLIEQITEDWFVSLEAARCVARMDELKRLADEAPQWLLELPNRT